jgi:hypothetical protein
MGKSQDLFRTNPQRTDAVAEQSLPDSDYRKIRDVFLVPTPNLKAVTDPGDSGGPVFLAGSGTPGLAPRHQVVGLVSRDVINYRNRVPVYRAVAFSRLATQPASKHTVPDAINVFAKARRRCLVVRVSGR